MKDILTKRYKEIWLIAAIVSLFNTFIVTVTVLIFWNPICLQIAREVVKTIRGL